MMNELMPFRDGRIISAPTPVKIIIGYKEPQSADICRFVAPFRRPGTPMKIAKQLYRFVMNGII